MNNIVFTKADEGNNLIALKESDFINITFKFIQTENCTTFVLNYLEPLHLMSILTTFNKDSTEKLPKEIKESIEDPKTLINTTDK